MTRPQIFISYAGHEAFEASLLQYAVETLLADLGVVAWTFQRDQARSQKEIAASLRTQVRSSVATIFLVSPATIDGGSTQWMELAYADAFGIPTFVILHHLAYADLLRNNEGVPPLLLSSQCNAASDWRHIVADLRRLIHGEETHNG